MKRSDHGQAGAFGADGKTLIGWREFVALPDWGITSVRAKIDTGARTSALHVEKLELLSGGRVRFEAVLSRRPERRRRIVARLARVARVRPSTGESQERYVVTTTMRLGPVEKTIQVSLVSRKRMLCRMLLGRAAIEGDFVVDPARKYALRPRKRKRRIGGIQ